MTTVSTLLAVAATPLLTKLLVGQLVPVSVGALLLSTLQVCAFLGLRSVVVTQILWAYRTAMCLTMLMPRQRSRAFGGKPANGLSLEAASVSTAGSRQQPVP